MNTQPGHASAVTEGALSRTCVPAAAEHGASLHDHDRDQDSDHDHDFEWSEMLRIAFIAVAAACVWWRLWEPFPAVTLIGVVGLAVGGWPIFREAAEEPDSRSE